MKTLTRTAMRALAIAATVATSATAMAAQVVARAAAPATTPTTSVLLGVQGCSYGICDPPTTLLLVRQGDSVRVTGRGAGLLVPRRDGFWWLLAQDGYTGGDRGYDRDEPTPDGLTTCDSILLGLRPPLPPARHPAGNARRHISSCSACRCPMSRRRCRHRQDARYGNVDYWRSA